MAALYLYSYLYDSFSSEMTDMRMFLVTSHVLPIKCKVFREILNSLYDHLIEGITPMLLRDHVSSKVDKDIIYPEIAIIPLIVIKTNNPTSAVLLLPFKNLYSC